MQEGDTKKNERMIKKGKLNIVGHKKVVFGEVYLKYHSLGKSKWN